ncbi:MAG TPA: hypothetical protein VGE74_07465 [Gemmata sp.]
MWHEHPRLESDRQLVAAAGVNPDFAPLVSGLFIGAGAFMLCGVAFGVIGSNFPGAVRAAFCPLCHHFEPHHATRLGLVCFVLLVPWLGTVLRVVDQSM